MQLVVYAITHRQSGKRYIGATNNFANRVRQHRRYLRRGEHHSLLLQRAWAKHGAEAFDFEIIGQAEDFQTLHQMECDLIRQYKTTEASCGFNSPDTGINGSGYPRSPETKKKLSAALRGRPAPWVSAALTGRPLPLEQRAKQSATMKGRPRWPGSGRKLIPLPEAEIRQLHAGGKSEREIAKQYGVTQIVIQRRLRLWGIRPNPTGRNLSRRTPSNKDKGQFEPIFTEAYLRKRYIEDCEGSSAIARDHGCYHGVVLHYLRKRGIPLRTTAEAARLRGR